MRWLKSLPVWIGTCLLVVIAFVLHRIPHSTEMTLHLVTKNLAFVLPDREQPLIQGVSLTSLTLYGVPALALEVEELQHQGHLLKVPGNRILVRAQQPLASYTLRALPDSELRLIQLDLSGRSEVLLSTAGGGQLQVDVKSPQLSQLELAIVGRRFTLIVTDGTTVLDEQGHEMPLPPGPSPLTLEVMAASSRLVLEPQAETPFGLDMHIASQEQAGKMWELSPAFGRVPLTRVAFPSREVSNRPREAVIQEFWVEPFMPRDKAKTHVVVKLQEEDTFTLQAMRLSDHGLVCEIVGTTNRVLVGKESPHENLVPSWLEYIVEDVFFQKVVCKPLGLC
jgi:hypothetical protein